MSRRNRRSNKTQTPQSETPNTPETVTETVNPETETVTETPEDLKAVKISHNKLGEYAKRYNACKPENQPGFLAGLADSYNVTPAALLVAMTPFLDKSTESNKLQGKRGHFVKVQRAAFEAAQYDNGLLQLDVNKTSADGLRGFMRGMKDSKRKLAELLHSADFTPSATQGYGYFLHAPPFNLLTEETLETPQFHLVSSGWTGERSYPYYGVRLIPSKNRENINRIQYTLPEPVTVDGKTVTVPECYSEEFDSLYLKGDDTD